MGQDGSSEGFAAIREKGRIQKTFFDYACDEIRGCDYDSVVGSVGLEYFPLQASVSLAIVPGASKAVLILEDGEEVALESMEGDRLDISQSGVRVQSMGSGIVYSDTVKKRSGKSFNRLNTPRGGEYNVILADGTRVYLNAASSLKYPVVFDEKERTVYLSGEAYFDVTSDKDHPFLVELKKSVVKVLGTSFDIRAH